tara:strand:+ start:4099 stop:4815 length:717 start_codon:yes stop_codon:yes gene_type:complete
MAPCEEIIEVTCWKCEKATYQSSRLLAGSTACHACCDQHELEEKTRQCRDLWEKICPPLFRDTDIKRDDFPLAILKELQARSDGESLLLFGPTGSAKTRVAMELLKRAIWHGKSANTLWPEELTEYAKGRERLPMLHRYSGLHLLLLDDALLTGAADERVASFLKDLIDMSQRQGNSIIITSQVGGADYMQQAKKFNNLTAADSERIAALMRRIRERCRTVTFGNTSTTTIETQGKSF